MVTSCTTSGLNSSSWTLVPPATSRVMAESVYAPPARLGLSYEMAVFWEETGRAKEQRTRRIAQRFRKLRQWKVKPRTKAKGKAGKR